MTRLGRLLIVTCCMGVAHAQTVNPSSKLGLQRAAASKLEWEVKDAGHPSLGNIRFAFLKTPVETTVGNAKIYTRVYLSCQTQVKRLAIELTNGTRPDDNKGLKPNADPKLVCTRPIQPFDEKLVQEDLLANWDVNELGDVLARGFRFFPLRECVSIKVVQQVALPAGWSQKSAKVEFDISPYERELDQIFTTCGDVSAYTPPKAAPTVASAAAPAKAPQPTPAVAPAKAAAPPPPAAAPAKATTPSPPAPAPAADGWIPARALSTGGKTNVRAAPNTTGAVVAQIDPGTPVQVQRTANEWWKARGTSGGKAFEGYIRQDRLAFR